MSGAPITQQPNTYALMSAAAGPMKGPLSDVRDVQERWIDAREEYDEFEKKQWQKEGEMVREEATRAGQVRERNPGEHNREVQRP